MRRLAAIIAILVTTAPACGDDPLQAQRGLDVDADLPRAVTDADGLEISVADWSAYDDTPVTATDAQALDIASETTPEVLVPPCTTPNPFVPPGSPTGWKRTSTSLLTVTQGSPNARGQDVVATAGGPQWLIGKFAYGPFDKDLQGEDVEVFIQSGPPCGAWTSFGVVASSDEGDNGTVLGVEDDGGRVFFQLTGATTRAVGTHPVRMLVHGDHSAAAFNLHVFEPGTQTVVFDIDGTLTVDDFELAASLFSDIFSGAYLPELHPGAVELTRAYADKGYQLVYLSARPEWLKVMSKQAMIAGGFPPGVMHLAETNTESLTDTANYKAAFLGHLLQTVQLDIVSVYGNADTDVEAYEMAGLAKSTTFIIGDNAGMAGTTPISDYPSHLPFVQALPDATTVPPSPTQW